MAYNLKEDVMSLFGLDDDYYKFWFYNRYHDHCDYHRRCRDTYWPGYRDAYYGSQIANANQNLFNSGYMSNVDQSLIQNQYRNY